MPGSRGPAQLGLEGGSLLKNVLSCLRFFIFLFFAALVRLDTEVFGFCQSIPFTVRSSRGSSTGIFPQRWLNEVIFRSQIAIGAGVPMNLREGLNAERPTRFITLSFGI